jgi:hypothetical protein
MKPSFLATSLCSQAQKEALPHTFEQDERIVTTQTAGSGQASCPGLSSVVLESPQGNDDDGLSGCSCSIRVPGSERSDESTIFRLFMPRRSPVERCLCCRNPLHEGDCPPHHEGMTTPPPLPGQIWREGHTYEEENAYLLSLKAQWGFW